ncbi:MAG TPA: FAD-dependent oxidoreductase [Pyrinomonadaceae bacterium]|jgi:monoamine oxidase|nr:FAD-dependent oxidoreductase [Pyrinomonadaceae bacterium]
MTKKTKGVTRRRFLEQVGMAGGSAALYETMTALGLIHLPEAWAGPPEIPQGGGKSVVILGAGIAGLTAAYELTRANYNCKVIELTERPGGRNHTARRGTVVKEINEKGVQTEQVCNFDEGLYLNLGPGRLPYHHRRVLHYCNEFGVALEVYVMETMANLFQSDKAFGGKAQLRRRIAYDTQGYIAEMLAKAVNQNALNAELDATDRDNLLCLLKNFGDLGQNDLCSKCGQNRCNKCNVSCDACISCSKQCVTCFRYTGSTRDGCEITVQQPCEPGPTLPLKELLSSEYWRFRFYQSFEYEWQPTLFQPVGGMDKIVDGFVGKVGSLIQYDTKVLDIQIGNDGVKVVTETGGTRTTISADYCISNIPLPLLAKISNNFDPGFDAAVKQCIYDPTCKLGWQSNKRFWENDKNQIYGGISYTDDPITQMWYPSYDYFTKNGTLTGVYNYDQNAIDFGNMSLTDRIRDARRGAVKFHPEFADERVVPSDKAISIAWQNIPSEGGGWANWDPNSTSHAKAYSRLLAPDRRFYVTGDQVSQLPGWQEGAMMSAQHVVEQIGGKRLKTVPLIKHAPNTRRLIQGRS